jgi:hypothetical protein
MTGVRHGWTQVLYATLSLHSALLTSFSGWLAPHGGRSSLQKLQVHIRPDEQLQLEATPFPMISAKPLGH